MQLQIRKTDQYLVNGKREPSRGASSLELAAITLCVVAVIGLSGLLV